MKKILYCFIALFVASAAFTACNDDDDDKVDSSDYWNRYRDNREKCEAFYQEQKNLTNPDGSKYYEVLNPLWDNGAEILIHWFNDRSKTAANLTPMLTSTVTVGYKGWLIDGVGFDSSYTSLGSTASFTLSDDLIDGWKIALCNMHVGDSVRIVLPYQQGYGVLGRSPSILPYSTLLFDINLVDIPYYEVRP